MENFLVTFWQHIARFFFFSFFGLSLYSCFDTVFRLHL